MAKSPRVRGVSEGEERTELLGLVDFWRSATLGSGVIICRILPVDKCQPMRGQGQSTVWLLSSIIGLYSEQNVNVVLRGQSVIGKENLGSSYLANFSIADTILARGFVYAISFRLSHSLLAWAMLPSLHFRLLALHNQLLALSRFVTCTQYNRDETLAFVSALAAS